MRREGRGEDRRWKEKAGVRKEGKDEKVGMRTEGRRGFSFLKNKTLY